MNTSLNKIDEAIEKLKQCKEILAIALVDDKDSFTSLNEKIDIAIRKLETGKDMIVENKTRMDNAKVWD